MFGRNTYTRDRKGSFRGRPQTDRERSEKKREKQKKEIKLQ